MQMCALTQVLDSDIPCRVQPGLGSDQDNRRVQRCGCSAQLWGAFQTHRYLHHVRHQMHGHTLQTTDRLSNNFLRYSLCSYSLDNWKPCPAGDTTRGKDRDHKLSTRHHMGIMKVQLQQHRWTDGRLTEWLQSGGSRISSLKVSFTITSGLILSPSMLHVEVSLDKTLIPWSLSASRGRHRISSRGSIMYQLLFLTDIGSTC